MVQWLGDWTTARTIWMGSILIGPEFSDGVKFWMILFPAVVASNGC